ncbi:Alpha/Beta hydrolase protein [Pisolithus croceorrhizus]|nr:Alpha/Beta hydrolase protein [Pisolithus croceorrhizus]
MSASVAASPSSDIPLTFTASLKSWWHAGEKQGAAAEERLLRYRTVELIGFTLRELISPSGRLPFFVPEKMPTSSAGDTPKHYLNTLSIKSTNTVPNAPPSCRLGFFFRNYPALATWAGHRGTDVYALDWLGMGRSAPSHMHYAIPTRVNKLILLSPAGVTRDPNNLTMPSREPVHANARPATSASTSAVSHIRNEQRAARNQESRTMKLVTYLWEEGWSPFQLVRSTLFWGPMLVGKYSSRRFSSLTEDETRDMHEYILNITLSKGSGEYCISHILAPFAHARMPLVDRISALKMPITFVYGEHDWMDPVGGLQSLQQLREAGNRFGRMFVIPSAGHHLYLENPRAVDDLLIQELDLTDKQH